MTPIQEALTQTLLSMGDRSRFTDTQLAKKLQEITKIQKKKAVIALDDLLAAQAQAALQGKIYSITVNNASDLIIDKTQTIKELPLEQKQRRHKHEKSQIIFTSGDLKNTGKNHKSTKTPSRTQRTKMDIYASYEEE